MTALNGPILFNSASGSDTAASGVGPSTAVSGTGASTNNTTTIDLSADSPDLSGVSAGDLFWVDSSSGRQFSPIASVNDGADTVTTDDTFTNTESGRNWGIGGKRASLVGSYRLLHDGATGADSKAGWIVEMESGYVETITTLGNECYAGGDTTTGPVIIRGEAGAASKPVISFSGTGSGEGFVIRSSYIKFVDLELKKITNSGGSAFECTADYVEFRGVDITSDGNDWGEGLMNLQSSSPVTICSFTGVSSTGIYMRSSSWTSPYVSYCRFEGASTGIDNTGSSNSAGSFIAYNIFDGCGDGVQLKSARSDGIANGNVIVGNVFHGCSGDGVQIESTVDSALGAFFILHNIFDGNGGYGINWSGVGVDDEQLASVGLVMQANAFRSNTSGKYNPSDLSISLNELVLTADPFVDSANGDFNINNTAGGGAALRAATLALPA